MEEVPASVQPQRGIGLGKNLQGSGGCSFAHVMRF